MDHPGGHLAGKATHPGGKPVKGKISLKATVITSTMISVLWVGNTGGLSGVCFKSAKSEELTLDR